MFGRNRRKAEAQIQEQLVTISAHFDAGYFDAGLESAMAAFELARKKLSPKNRLYAKSLSVIAAGYFLIGLYEESFRFYQQALTALDKIVDVSDPLYILCLNGLAGIYEATGDQNQEDQVLRSIIRIQLEAKGETHPDYAAALFALSDLYRRAGPGMLDMAKAGYEAVAGIYQAQPGALYEGHLAECRFGLAACLFQQGKYAEAEPLFEEVLATFRQLHGNTHAPIADLRQNLASIRAFAGKPAKALELLEASEAMYDHRIRHVFSRTSPEVRRLFLDQMMDSVSRFLSLAVQFFPHDPQVAQQVLTLIGKRKSLGLDSLLQQQQDLADATDPQIQAQAKHLQNLRARIAQKALSGADSGQSPHEHHTQMMQWEVAAQEIEQALMAQTAARTPDQAFLTFSLSALEKALPPNTVLIEFVQFRWFEYQPATPDKAGFQGGVHYLALTYSANGQASCTDLGAAAEMDQAIQEFRAALTGAGAPTAEKDTSESRSLAFSEIEPSTAFHTAGERVYSRIFEPLTAHLGAHTSLLIATDGEISRLPFDALPLGKAGFLIDSYEISYLGTARELLRERFPQAAQARSPWVMAGPDYDLSTRNWLGNRQASPIHSQSGEALRHAEAHFSPLPGTLEEGKTVAQLLGVAPFLKQEATKGKLFSCHSPLILHLATHGFFLADPNQELSRLGNAAAMQALRSGLVFAGANTWLGSGTLPEEAMDGILSSEDAANLHLAGTELVVLSACETGLGDVMAGEGVYGLSRAFALAGARTRVLSLWKVPDTQTQELMVHFYRFLLSGKGRSEALRRAKLAVKATAPSPYYWAAFVCQGETGPVPGLAASAEVERG